MRQPSAQLSRALDHIKAAITAPRAERSAELLPIRDLARDAGVAYNTMWKALAHYRTHGYVRTKPGSRTRVMGNPGDIPAIAPSPVRQTWSSGPRWKVLRERIARDILNGVYAPGEALPTMKELSARYGACYRTLRAAVSDLVSGGTVTVHGRHVRIPPLGATRRRARVCLLASGEEDGTIRYTTPRSHAHLRHLERECSREGVDLATRPLQRGKSGLSPLGGIAGPKGKRGDEASDALGYIVWMVGLATSAAEFTADLRAVMGLCEGGKKPVSILLEGGGFDAASMPDFGAKVKYFSLADDPADGRRVGQFLLNLGHRRVAYLSPFGGSAYERRLKGLRESFAAAGLPDAVIAIGPSDSPTPQTYEADQFTPVWQAVDDLLQRAEQRTHPRNVVLRRAFEALRKQAGLSTRAQLFQQNSVPLLNNALRDSSVTAIVAANDWVAVECLDLLRNRKIRVPADMSLVGFDDTEEAFLRGLTSYNFNGEAMMRAMLGHVLRPSWSPPGIRAAASVDGFVTSRGTTAMARTVRDTRERLSAQRPIAHAIRHAVVHDVC